jgi:hypothetical protein
MGTKESLIKKSNSAELSPFEQRVMGSALKFRFRSADELEALYESLLTESIQS